MKLASGAAPVTDLRAAGVAVGLGTDGAASNNDLDMFEAMRQASFLQKLRTRDPRAISAREAVEMATIDGARALGLDGLIGWALSGSLAGAVVGGIGGAVTIVFTVGFLYPLKILVSFLQAFIFVMLTMLYISGAIEEAEHHAEHH